MAAPSRPKIRERDLRGFKHFRRVRELLSRLHAIGTIRDKAGNRELFFDDYAALLLLYFFNPIVQSLRGLQQASGLSKVQQRLGVGRTSLGSLSEATGVFPAEHLRNIVQELAKEALPLEHGREAEALRGLTAVDGTLLPALPRMLWALWHDRDHHAAKMHLHFDVLRGVPCDATLTDGNSSELEQLRAMLQPGGYVDFQLFRDILNSGSSFVGRVKDNTVFSIAEERSVSPEARVSGVVRDLVIAKLGTSRHKDYLRQPVRLVIVRRIRTDGSLEELWLVTDRLDLDADLIALAYRFRWTVELFFRWLKCVLDCRHLLFEDRNGVAIQAYVALIASLLTVLWTGRKPTRRMWEMIQLYVSGWANLEEVFASLRAAATA
jgi:hypothetical protein